MDRPTTGKYTTKPYVCTTCGHKHNIGTNHWGECYPRCTNCGVVCAHKCLEPVPEGYSIPETWKIMRLGDIATIVEGANPS
jgi:hypothetical protein